MTELINKVKDAKKVLDDSQKELLTWCTSKSEPLSKRWEIWNKYVDKTEQCYIGCRESKLLDSLIRLYADSYDLDRHQHIYSDSLIESLCEYWDEGGKMKTKIEAELSKHTQLVRDQKIESIVNDAKLDKSNGNVANYSDFESILMEEIILANFGSCEYDW